MTEGTEPGWILSITAIFQILLLGGGLIALALVTTRWKQWKTERPELTAWRLAWPDFLLFVCLLLVWTMASGGIGYTLVDWFTAVADREELPETLFAAVASGLMQLGFIALFWKWREIHRSEAEGPLETRSRGPFCTLGVALGFLLASYPVVLVCSLGWTALLQWLDALGLPIDLSLQPQLDLFAGAENHFQFLLLATVAVIIAPIAEELVFRAGIFRFFLGRMSVPAAMTLSAFLFAMLHLNLYSFVPLMVFGVLLCVGYQLSGSIRVPIAMHALFNLNTVVLVWLAPEIVAP